MTHVPHYSTCGDGMRVSPFLAIPFLKRAASDSPAGSMCPAGVLPVLLSF